ncbi:MAG: DUF547 domain-containing protein [Pseudomonadota bacterium]
MIRRFLISALMFVIAASPAAASLERLFAPDSELEHQIWTEHSAGSTQTVDHSAWDSFLAQYLSEGADGINRVAYGKVTAADVAAVDAYIATLQAVDPVALNRAEQLAYWINLYNAQTVALILANRPVESIRDLGEGLFAVGPWDKKLVTVKGRELSLNDIEHGIVRPVFNEPRIHYALNCAALSCPDLGKKAYRGATLDKTLAEAERSYVNDPRGVRLVNGQLVLSSIYNWFREDFGANEAAVIQRLSKYATGDAKAALDGRSKVDDYAYDWSLNGS